FGTGRIPGIFRRFNAMCIGDPNRRGRPRGATARGAAALHRSFARPCLARGRPVCEHYKRLAREGGGKGVSSMAGVLADWQIQSEVKIEPFAESALRPGVISYGVSSYGYDVRVGRHFKVFTNALCAVVDPKNFDRASFVDVEGDYCLIPPNSFALAETVEYFEIPRDILSICVGKSTYARCGIIVNVTPLEPEWRGRVTIEISN